MDKKKMAQIMMCILEKQEEIAKYQKEIVEMLNSEFLTIKPDCVYYDCLGTKQELSQYMRNNPARRLRQ